MVPLFLTNSSIYSVLSIALYFFTLFFLFSWCCFHANPLSLFVYCFDLFLSILLSELHYILHLILILFFLIQFVLKVYFLHFINLICKSQTFLILINHLLTVFNIIFNYFSISVIHKLCPIYAIIIRRFKLVFTFYNFFQDLPHNTSKDLSL